MRLKTFISQVMYRKPVLGASGQRVSVEALTRQNEEIYWLDELLGGGLDLPKSVWERRAAPFIILLAGPPGTGKSIFAQQLSYQLAQNPQINSESAGDSKWTTLYISSESTAEQIAENAGKLGWNTKYFCSYKLGPVPKDHRVILFGIDKLMEGQQPCDFDVDTFINKIRTTWGEIAKQRNCPCADLLVIDSLNAFPSSWKREALFRDLSVFFANAEEINDDKGEKHFNRPRLIILSLDCFTGDKESKYWEYMANAVFRFDEQIGPQTYYQRFFQIIKIKTQEHCWGRQLMKIYPGAEDKESARVNTSPYIQEGGVFIFPSIHRHLGELQKRFSETAPSSAHKDDYPTPIAKLNIMIASKSNKGLPPESVTAFMGDRGAMKGHLAYYTLLAHALGKFPGANKKKGRKNCLLISLRDDIEDVKEILTNIAKIQGLASPRRAKRTIQNLVDNDVLEIIYQWPGYVAPSEFFHRIYVALERPRGRRPRSRVMGLKPKPKKAELVVINGLDHLAPRFPLCAAEPEFLPGLISLFRSFKVCSIFIAASEETAGLPAVGFGPLADLIIHFKRSPMSEAHGIDFPDPPGGVTRQAAKLTTLRVPAGRVGLQEGKLVRNQNGFISFVV